MNIDAGADLSVSRLCSLAAFLFCAFGRQFKILFEDVGGDGRFFLSPFSVKFFEA